MARLILVRHGESVWNAEHRYQGQRDSGLTDRGREQADCVGRLLCQERGSVSRVWSSDLPRARDTAAAYAGLAGLSVTPDARLREVDIGTWSGRQLTDVAAEFPELVAAAAEGHDVRRGGGETFAETRARVVACLTDIADGLDGTALVFSHGGAIRVAAAWAAGVPAPGHAALGAPTNCSRTIVDFRSGRPSLAAYNLPLPDAAATQTVAADAV